VRIEKVEVAHFKGLVGPLMVTFEAGLNVVHGPNEIGKSTMAEAIWNAMAVGAKGETKHHQTLRTHGSTELPRVRLVLRDGASSYEVVKSFGKSGSIKLIIREGDQVVDELADDAADDELRKLLGLGAWSRGSIAEENRGAFLLSWVHQGDAGLQPGGKLNARTRESIQAHLAEITGEALVGERGTRLYMAARGEYERHFTAGGSEKSGADAPLKVARTAAAEAERELDDLLEQVKSHGALVDQQATTRGKLVVARAKTELINANHGAAKQRLDELEGIERERNGKEHEHEKASAEHARLTASRQHREEVRGEEATQVEVSKELGGTIERNDAKAKRLTQDIAERQKKIDAARTQLGELKQTSEHGRALSQLAADVDSLQALESRHDKAREARSLQAEAQARVDTLLVTQDDLETLDRLDRAAREARIKLDAAAASIELVRHQEVGVTVDGAAEEGAVGESMDRTITSTTCIEVGDLLTLTIRPGGTDLSELEAALEDADAELVGELERLSVAYVVAARQVATERQQAEQEAKQQGQAVELHAPEGIASLSEAVETARAAVGVARQKLTAAAVDVEPTEATDEADRAALAAAAQAAEQEVQGASEALDELVEALASLNSELAGLNVDLAEDRANRKNALAKIDELLKTLAEEIEQDGADEALDQAIGEAAIGVQAAAAKLQEIDAQLADDALEGARRDLEDAERAVATNRGEITTLDNRISELAGQLRQTNMVGIHEQIAAAEAAKDHAGRALQRVTAESQAARLLYDTLTKHKEQTEQRFRAPLEQRIQALVRLLWPDAKITLNEQLEIGAIERPNKLGRDGFDALSAGASEQLGLVARLAMAQILAERGPLVMVLDDSLVVTDDDRLRDMARVINRVADDLQIIFLTCHWSHQSGLGLSPHKVVDLESLVNEAATASPTDAP